MSHKSDAKIDKYYTIEEVKELVDVFDHATLTRLYKTASSLAMIYRYDAKALAHDAITKLLSGERQWRKGYHITTIFKKICKSILSHYVEHNKPEDSLNEPNEEGTEPIDYLPGKYMSPEQQLILVDIRDQVIALFKDDPVATNLIEGRLEGFKKGDLLDLLDLTDTEYETAWKKIRRRMKKNYQGSMV